MLRTNNNIIIVDDREDDINSLTTIFNESGVGCHSFLFDNMTFPNEPLKGVKIAFFDMYLANAGDETAQFAVLQNALIKYISNSDIPYVLVFWTSHTDLVERFKTFVRRDADAAKDVPKPISIIPIDKRDFIDGGADLKTKLQTVLSDNIVECLFSFDDVIQESVESSFNNILKLIPFENDEWGDSTNYKESMKVLFSCIALQTMGVVHAKENPDKGINEVIAPAFLYDLLQRSTDTWKRFLALDQKSEDEIKAIRMPSNDIAPKLNTVININPSTTDVEARGSVRKINLENDGKDYFLNAFSISPEDFVEKEMLSLKKGKTFFDKAMIVGVEFSAACDYAHNKPRLHRYMLGLIAKNEDYNDCVDNKLMRNKGAQIHVVPFDFYIGEDIYKMVLNLNFTFSEEKNDIFHKLSDKLFAWKNDFMNSLGAKYADHISRIGFTSFK